MTMPTSALVAFLAATTSSSKSTTTSGASFFIPLVIFGLLAWLLFLRPRSQQAKRQRQDMTNVDIGDEVLTGAGIFGTIVAMEGDRIVLETAPGSQVTVLRSTIARRLTETEPVADDHDDWDDDEDSHEVRSSGGGATTDVHDIDVGGTDTIDQNGKSEP
ncbi:MAG TPA: preprotein translocase subunit YajC, partial [Acidimicrobiales bacterium]|nr:preprotein translocase subunit YajC [Acidimicrobiales bacterium]